MKRSVKLVLAMLPLVPCGCEPSGIREVESREPVEEDELRDLEAETPQFVEWFVGSHPVTVFADEIPLEYDRELKDGINATMVVKRVSDGGNLLHTTCGSMLRVDFDVSVEVPTPDVSIVLVPEFRASLTPSRSQFLILSATPPTAADIERLAGVVSGAEFPDSGAYEPELELELPGGDGSPCVGHLVASPRDEASGEVLPFVEFRCR